MPLNRYGVLKGAVLHRLRPKTNNDHYQILVTDGVAQHRIAVNVLSKEKPSELLYFTTESLPAKMKTALKKLKDGFTPLPSKAGGLALDFVRGGMFKQSDMKVLPNIKPGPKNDLGDAIDEAVMDAIHADKPRIYAFGQAWGPEKNKRDKYFDFDPGSGIHDIHMNQGNVPRFKKDDGIWQDGALALHFPAEGGKPEKWVGVFLAFQSQGWNTDAQGHVKKKAKAMGAGG
ncbi:MAG: DUF2278 family protein [Bryobacteraceae bacterium]